MSHIVLAGHPLMAMCQKFVSRHKPLSHRQWLERMLSVPEIDLSVDSYGRGPLIDKIETKMAALLGKEQALFMAKGMVAQHSVILGRTTAANNCRVALHPQSHMMLDEAAAITELLGVEPQMFGQEYGAFAAADIAALPDDLALIIAELPVRRAGFQLPAWDDLLALKAHADERGTPVHFDGARLFESLPHWGKSMHQVTNLCDSVYVSTYKMLGAAAGAVVAGDADFIARLKPWRTRMAGDIVTIFPYALTTLWGLEHYLPRVSSYVARAKKLGALIAAELGAEAIPYPVQSTGFLVELPLSVDALAAKALSLAEGQKIWLCDKVMAATGCRSDERCCIEIQVGDALDDWRDDAFIATLKGLLR